MKNLHSIGFIGGGRATRFLLEGWKLSGLLRQGIRVADSDAGVLGVLQRDFPEIVAVSVEEAAASDLVVLAVHPPAMKDVLTAIKPHVTAGAVILSLAPKVTAAAIAGALGTERVVRMIPNAPSAVGKGYNPVSYSDGIDSETKSALAALFASWGDAPEVPEKDLEAYAILSAMGPTYMWFQWQTLRELAVGFGLDPAAADRALLKMIEGAAECLLAWGKEPADVMNMIPIRPLQEHESVIVEAYRTKLTALYEKIKAKP